MEAIYVTNKMSQLKSILLIKQCSQPYCTIQTVTKYPQMARSAFSGWLFAMLSKFISLTCTLLSLYESLCLIAYCFCIG